MKYNSYACYLAEKILGKKSTIYLCMMMGEKVSPMIRATIKRNEKIYRNSDLKRLLAECRKCEEVFDREEGKQNSFDIN